MLAYSGALLNAAWRRVGAPPSPPPGGALLPPTNVEKFPYDGNFIGIRWQNTGTPQPYTEVGSLWGDDPALGPFVEVTLAPGTVMWHSGQTSPNYPLDIGAIERTWWVRHIRAGDTPSSWVRAVRMLS